MVRTATLFSVLSCLLTSCTEEQAVSSESVVVAPEALSQRSSPTFRVTGRVLHIGTGEGVSGAEVTIQEDISNSPMTVTSGKKGQFVFEGVAFGRYVFDVTHEEFVQERAFRPVDFARGKATGHILRVRDAETVSAIVLDAVNGSVVPDATVRLKWSDASWRRRYPGGQRLGSSGKSGNVQIRGVAAGDHHVIVAAPGYLRRRYESVKVSKSRGTLQFELEPGEELAGVVRTPEGRPAPGVRVEVDLNSELNYESRTTTDAKGAFVLRGIQSCSTYTLVCSGESGVAWVNNVSAPRGKPVEVKLRKPRRLGGRVLGELGVPIAGAEVRAELRSCWVDTIAPEAQEILGMKARHRFTDESGRFSFPNLPPTCYTVIAGAAGKATEEREVDLRGGAEVDFYLRSQRLVRGRVLNSDGSPVGGAYVQVESEDTSTGSDGVFEIEAPARRVRVRADCGDRSVETTVVLPNEDFTLVLPAPARVDGRVTAQDGSPLAGVLLAMRRDGQSWERTVLADGIVYWSLPHGTY
ncbi:MAG: carboxypeptidase-like regulatory domain-containing protein, partial [Planctomycetota bacterium]